MCVSQKQKYFQEEQIMYSLEEVRTVDPEIADLIVKEQERQNSHIELIASENWVSKAVMAAMGSVLTNKYAEGYPGKTVFTADASGWTKWKRLPSNGQKKSSDAPTQTCSLIPALRRTWRSFLRC